MIPEVVDHGSRAVIIEDDATEAITRFYTIGDESCKVFHGGLRAGVAIANLAAPVVPSAVTLGVKEIVHPVRHSKLCKGSRGGKLRSPRPTPRGDDDDFLFPQWC